MIPLSVENESLGNPFNLHLRTIMGVANATSKLKLSLDYSEPPACFNLSCHVLINLDLNWAVKTPRLDTDPAAKIMSPRMSFKRYSNLMDWSTHRSRSPPSPPINWLALSNFISQSWISMVRDSCFSWVSDSLSWSSLICLFSASNSDLVYLRLAYNLSTSCLDWLYLSCLGRTTLRTFS